MQPIKSHRMKNEFNWIAKTTLEVGITKSIQQLKKENEIEKFNKSFIPCFHRIHSSENTSTPAHMLQIELGFSVTVDEIEQVLSEYTYNKFQNTSARILVTFDDGYCDVLILERFFEENPIYQPVIFYPTCLFESKSLWFDKFYFALANADYEVLSGIAHKWKISSNQPIDKITIAKGDIKERLRNSNPIEQEKMLNEIFETNSHIDFKNLYLQKADLRRLVKKGWIIGSHGHHHYNYTISEEDVLKKELKFSLTQILDTGGRAWLAYPDGRWSEMVKRVALKVGFKRLFTLHETSRNKKDPRHYYRKLICGSKLS